MEYLIGTKEEFFKFVENIREWEKVAILSHDDLDGLASAIFLEKILKSKEKNVISIKFLKHKKNYLFDEISSLRQLGITKIFICDLAVDANLEEFSLFKNTFETFLIDHHPANQELDDKKNIIKTESFDCATYCIYDLGKEILEDEEWGWLVCATMFSEFSYRNEKNFEFMRKFYPDLNLENISTSVPGLNGRKIGNALIYYSNQPEIVYKIVNEKNLSELEDINKILEDEIDYHVENYLTEAKYYPEKKLYIYKLNSKYNISSPVITIISKYKPEYSFIIYAPDKNSNVKISARNQSIEEDMSELMKKGIQGLNDAVGGGHKAAAGATIKEEDLEKFIENILRD